VYFTPATSALLTQQRSRPSQMARGYRMGVQASSPMAAIAARRCGFIWAVTEKNAPARRTEWMNAAE
jgi:hypothetical protein